LNTLYTPFVVFVIILHGKRNQVLERALCTPILLLEDTTTVKLSQDITVRGDGGCRHCIL
jgi:hypothetical protein